MNARIFPDRVAASLYYGGKLHIIGTVYRQGVVSQQRVVLLDAINCKVIASVQSGENGVYQFSYFAEGPHYIALSTDSATVNTATAAVADQLVLTA